jgi:hypothetical protein
MTGYNGWEVFTLTPKILLFNVFLVEDRLNLLADLQMAVFSKMGLGYGRCVVKLQKDDIGVGAMLTLSVFKWI